MNKGDKMVITMNTKEKGNLLENIVEQLCSGIKNAKVTKNAKILGKRSSDKREIDVLVEGQVGAFPVKIIVEAKNYKRPVGVEKIESLKSKLDDIGGDLGVIVCPNGFTKAARTLALSNGIKLFEVVDPQLGNSDLFIPLRYIWPSIKACSYEFIHRTIGEFSISQESSRWLFHVDNQKLNTEQLAWHAWNRGMIPQSAGEHTANFNAMAVSDTEDPSYLQYCEIKIYVQVIEKYYLKLVPAFFLHDLESGKKHFNLDIHVYSQEKGMLKAGWKEFSSLEEMNKAAEIENQPNGVQDLIMKPSYQVDIHQYAE